jgi:hypothetical protein
MSSESITPAPEAAAPAPSLEDRIAALEQDLRDAQRAARDARVRASVHRALVDAGPVDLDAVALVIEASVGHAGAEPDAANVARAVEDLRRSRPALFRPAASGRSAAMATRVERAASNPLADAAQRARRSGDRAALVEYLRLRRRR